MTEDAALITRVLGAVALLGVGVVHIQQYAADAYSSIPTIGTLFVLNFASATVVGLGLLLPVRGHRLLALGGIGIAAGSLAAVLMAENGSVFGFSERGYRFAIVLSIVLEVVTVVALSAFSVLAANQPRSSLRTSATGPR